MSAPKARRAAGEPAVRRGDYVLVVFDAHDEVEEGECVLARAVRVRRSDGAITHVCSLLAWRKSLLGPPHANGTTSVRFHGHIREVCAGAPEDERLETLEGVRWPDVEAARAAIREALA